MASRSLWAILLFSAFELAFALCATPNAANAQDAFGDAAPVSREVLTGERGGFYTTNGIEFGFAAILQTALNGQVLLTSTLTLQDNGSVTTQTNVSADSNASGNVQVIPVTGGAQFTAASGINLSGVQGSGVVIKSASGITAFVNNFSGDQLQNIVLNTANNQIITQNTAITLTLPATGSLAQSPLGQLTRTMSEAVQLGGFSIGR